MLTLKKTKKKQNKTKTKQNKTKQKQKQKQKQTNIILNKRSAAIKYYNQLSIFTDISDCKWCCWGWNNPPFIHSPSNNTDTSYADWLESSLIPVKICH